MVKIFHLISHPIQYFAPLYEQIAAASDMDFEVLFCSKIGVEAAAHDVEFGVSVQWDIPLLRGYQYRFLKNQARRESLDGFFGLLNFGIVRVLARAPRNSIIWIHGWNYATHVLALLAAKFYGHRVFLRGENTAVIENQNADGWKKRFKKFYLSRLIFPLVDTFLTVGNQNKAFFKLMGVSENRMVFTPYCIDNHRFIADFQKLKRQKNQIQTTLGIPVAATSVADSTSYTANKSTLTQATSVAATVLIFSGKYIEKKRPLDLLRALSLLPNKEDVFAVFVGEGKLRGEMEQFINDHDLRENVLLTGFVNQSQMSNYYAAGDIFVMCSGTGETWGLSTNEAMCFGLPVILSDMVGSAYDLVDGNGTVFPCGDVQKLTDAIQNLLDLPQTAFAAKGQRSSALIEQYSYAQIITGLKQAAHKTDAPTPSYAFL